SPIFNPSTMSRAPEQAPTADDRSEYEQKEDIQIKRGTCVGQYEIVDRIAPESGQNTIFIVKDTKKDNQMCAMKVEIKADRSMKTSMLELELWILMTMKKKTDASHFCKVFARGSWDKYEFMTLTLCGKSLRNLLKNHPNKKFSLGCALGVANQCLRALMHLHKVGFIHRDVQPSNFAIGKGSQKELRTIYILDFYYIHKFQHNDGAHKEARAKPTKFNGNWKYASKSAHKGREMNRACDLESWFYVLLEIVNGTLPWSDTGDADEIFKKKKELRREEEVQKKVFDGLPKELIKLYKAIRGIKYKEEPPYGEFIDLLDEAKRHAHAKEFPYDW
ncbi:hypothetical protein PFISCL1PPCAC_6976, partial [Pristionchus fissidentatus]